MNRPPLHKSYRRFWAVLIAIGVILEAIGIFRKKGGDTLSEYTWSKTKVPVMRGLVTALLSWLVYHFSFGASTPFTKWDLISAGFGALVGGLSFFVQVKK